MFQSRLFHEARRGGLEMGAAVALLSCSPAIAQPVHEQLWATDGTVNAVAESGGTVYLGGTFSRVGPATGAFAPLDAANGAPLASFPRVSGRRVYAVCPDGSGGWYIGGNFTHVDGLPRSCLAHVTSDYSVAAWDPAVSSQVTHWVSTLAVSGSKVYVGGSFTEVDGLPRNNIAAVDAVTGEVTSWNPNASGRVNALAIDGSTVYVGGDFQSIGGQPRNHIAALHAATGVATPWNPNATGPWLDAVNALAVDGSTIYAGGRFTSIGGQPRSNVAALDASTGQATAWDPSADDDVYTLEVSGPTVYVGGTFTNVGGQPRNHVAALDAGTGQATAWDPNADALVLDVAVDGSTVYVGGYFTGVGGQPRNRVAALDAATGAATAWNPDVAGNVRALALDGSTVAVGGDFKIVGGVVRDFVAALNAGSGMATPWNPAANGAVAALAVSGSTVYAGGLFTAIGGQSRSHIAALDAGTGAATAWDPSADDVVNALAVDGATVYAGGEFASIGGQSRTRLAALDAATGAATPWTPIFLAAPNLVVSVHAIALTGSSVFAGGEFWAGGTALRRNVVAFDRDTGATVDWEAVQATPAPVRAVLTDGSTVYIGGDFDDVSGQPRKGIAALDAATGAVTAWDPNATHYTYVGPVHVLARDGSTVYAGGNFDRIGGQPRSGLAALDAGSGLASDWNPKLGGVVFALALSGPTVHVGGAFSSVKGLPHANIAAIGGVATAAPDAAGARPVVLQLGSHPNPFRSSTRIRFVLPGPGGVRVDLFDVAGRRVATLLDEAWMSAGPHDMSFRPRELAGGVYLIRLQARGEVVTRKIHVLR